LRAWGQEKVTALSLFYKQATATRFRGAAKSAATAAANSLGASLLFHHHKSYAVSEWPFFVLPPAVRRTLCARDQSSTSESVGRAATSSATFKGYSHGKTLLHTDAHFHQSNASSPQRGNRCPGCGAVGDYSPAVELRGSFSWPAFIVGGFFAVLFRNAGRRRKVKCNQCGHLFYIRTPLSNLSLLFFWILILLGVAGIVWWLVGLILTVLSH